jgi:biopolymer transport protein ExbD
VKFRNAGPEPAGFQLAPMIDIVFLLLIFFIVTWQFSRSEMDLKVSVPTSTEGRDNRRSLREIIINVRDDGTMIVDGQLLTEEEVLSKLAIIVRLDENQPVRLRGDAGASWQTMVEVIDIVERAGIWNISFATQKPQPGN